MLVDYNSEVKKGQLLAVIDPQLFEAAVEQARANHLAAQCRGEIVSRSLAGPQLRDSS